MDRARDGFYWSNDPTNSVKALKEDMSTLQSHQVHPAVFTIIQLCSMKKETRTHKIHTDKHKSMHSEMGLV